MKKLKNIVGFVFLSLGAIAGCGRHIKLMKKQVIIAPVPANLKNQVKEQRPIITIWIHGTRPSKKMLKRLHTCAQTLVKLFGVTQLPYVHSKPGIHQVSNVSKKYRLRTQIEALSASAPLLYPLEHCYIFGWSGKLSFDERKKQAQYLYDELSSLTQSYYDKYQVQPYIRLITHSHGGNIALNLASIDKRTSPHISIDELILLACPVQQETSCYIANPMFKKIYSLYSHGDIIQIIDPQGLYHRKKRTKQLFSERRFDHHEKLRQVHVSFNGKPLLHVSFILLNFIKCIPTIIQEIDTWYNECPMQKNEVRKLRVFTTHNLQ